MILASATVVGAFDPGDDRQPELGASGPPSAVRDVLTRQGEKLSMAIFDFIRSLMEYTTIRSE